MPEIDHPVSRDRADLSVTASANTFTIIFGVIATLLGVFGIAGLFFNIVFLSGVLPGFKPIGVSAALAWIFFGLVLVFQAKRPLKGASLGVITAVLIVIAITAALELPLKLMGRTFLVEDVVNSLATRFMSGQITPVSPVATFFIILSAVALFLVLRTPDFPDNPKAQDSTGIIGFFLVLMSFTVVLSYGFGAPFLYKTTIIPIAFISALAAFVIGLGLITTAGSSSMPLRYLTGPTIRARLLRSFLPLIVIIVLSQGLLQATLVSFYHVDNAILVSTGLMIFCLITAYVVGKTANEVGRLLDSEEEKRRKAEDLLLESEETFRALAENANDGILVAVGTGVHVFANRRAAEITGYSVDELVGMSIKDLAHPDEFSRTVQERYKKTLAGELFPREYETTIVRKDKRNVPIEVTSAKTDWKGYPADLVIIRDISVRKQTEEALRENEQRLRRFYESGLFGAIYWTTDGKITDANDTFLKMVGYTRADLMSGMIDWVSMTPPEYRYLDERSLEELKATGVNKTAFEKEYIRRDGTRISVLIAGAMLDEKRSRGIAILLDNTERKRAEDAMRESEEKFRVLFTSMIEGSALHELVYDSYGNPVEYRIIDINPAFERILGLKRVEVIGKTSREAYAVDTPPYLDIYARVAATSEPEVFEVYFAPMKKYFAISVYSPKKGRFATIFDDITERKRAEEKIKISETRYRRLFESAKDGILILNRDSGEIIDANPYIETLLGYAPKDLLGKRLWEIGFFKDQLASKVAFEELQSKEYLRYEDLPLETKNGERKEVEFVSNVYPIDHTSVIQCNIRDITDRKMIEYQREVLIRGARTEER